MQYDVASGAHSASFTTKDGLFAARFNPHFNVLALSGDEKDATSKPIVLVFAAIPK